MTQSMIAGIFKGVGIVPTLFIIGLVLSFTGINPSLGNISITSSIFIGVVLGFLGIMGVLKRLI